MVSQQPVLKLPVLTDNQLYDINMYLLENHGYTMIIAKNINL